MFNCERHRGKESSAFNTRKFRFKFEIMTDYKNYGEMQEVSRSHNI